MHSTGRVDYYRFIQGSKLSLYTFRGRALCEEYAAGNPIVEVTLEVRDGVCDWFPTDANVPARDIADGT